MEYFNPQLQNLQTQMQQLQTLIGQKPTTIQAPAAPPQAIPQVDGLEGAREYLKKLPANSTAAVFDKSDTVFFGLAVDANGVPQPIKRCPYTMEDVPEPGSNAITRQDFEEFKKEMRDAMAALVKKEDPE